MKLVKIILLLTLCFGNYKVESIDLNTICRKYVMSVAAFISSFSLGMFSYSNYTSIDDPNNKDRKEDVKLIALGTGAVAVWIPLMTYFINQK